MPPMASRYATDLVKPEYEYALKKSTNYTIKKVVDCMYSVARKEEGSKSYLVNKKLWTCSCAFTRTRLLPCRYVHLLSKASTERT